MNADDFAFLEHIVVSMSKKGRATILFPHGVLFRDGEDKLRENLSLDEEECLHYQIVKKVNEKGDVHTISWDVSKEDAEIPIGDEAREIIISHFKTLESQGVAVSQSAFELYERLTSESQSPELYEESYG